VAIILFGKVQVCVQKAERTEKVTLINQKAIEAPGEKKKPFWKFW
jgi:hypothetical protein